MEAQNARRRSYQVVIAATRDMGIGIDMKLPWDLPNEFQFFQDVTSRTSDPRKRNATIMGRKSWEATPLEFRPLPDRLIKRCPHKMHYMNAPSCDAIHLTEVDISVPCDTFAPRVDTCLYHPWYSSLPVVENGIRYCFNTYVQRKDLIFGSGVEAEQYSFLPTMVFERHEEFGYLTLVQNIISNGDMNAYNTLLSKFGCQKVFWVGVVEEILQLISGSTYPKEKGINHICESDKAKEYLDSFGVNATEEDGDHPLLTGLYWSYSDVRLVSSTEASLGIPFSIAAYSLLTCIMAHVCDIVAGDFIHLIGDAHVNTSHTKAIQRQLQISPKPFPILKINPEKTKIDHLEASDLDLLDI
ncbi:hypothetical protein F2Q70_00009050 [Brassica cretica]|uniref:dihydrofolate reductase n=1 Tax=Brassica cretica TaxID=69181 RepID=A0A8S9JIK5_BRACR|nr:hypothetical protein F2Q68_00002123 [Brassica cretica]KAF2611153.1 hypothetical protein F2Q70_00009050 [Brassica cretica]